MLHEVRIPKLGLDTLECDIRQWFVAVGERVEKGAPLLEVETEKAVMPIEAEVAGILREARVKPGETIDVGAVIGLIED